MASKLVQQKPPVTMTATLDSYPRKPVTTTPGPEESTNYEAHSPPYPRKPVTTTPGPEESINYEAQSPPPPGTPPWDYFGLFQPVDDRYTLDDGHGVDHTDDIRRLREEEGIPELEEEQEEEEQQEQEQQEQDDFSMHIEQEQEHEVEQKKEKLPSGDVSGDDFGDTDDDDFDKSSKEPLVRMFKNHNLLENHDVVEDLGSDTEQHIVGGTYETDESRTTTPVHVFNTHDAEDSGSDLEPQENGEKENNMSHIGTEESRTRTPVRTPPRVVNQRDANPPVANGNLKEFVRNRPRDFSSCMKEIEELFRKAAESGREVPRMLDDEKVHPRPLTADEIGWNNFPF